MRRERNRYDRTLGRADYQSDGIGINDVDAMGDRRVERIHQRLIHEATRGLVAFDASGDIRLAVDPATVRVREVLA